MTKMHHGAVADGKREEVMSNSWRPLASLEAGVPHDFQRAVSGSTPFHVPINGVVQAL